MKVINELWVHGHSCESLRDRCVSVLFLYKAHFSDTTWLEAIRGLELLNQLW